MPWLSLSSSRPQVSISQQWTGPIRVHVVRRELLPAEWRWCRGLPTGLLGPATHTPADHQGSLRLVASPLWAEERLGSPSSGCLSLFQITRSHYQNAVTATRMDSSPQTPDADTRLADGGSPEPPAALMPPPPAAPPPPQTTASLMPPPREPSRPSSARNARGHQSSVSHSTTLLNEKNRIVRESPRQIQSQALVFGKTVLVVMRLGFLSIQEANLMARRVPAIQCSCGWMRSHISERTTTRRRHLLVSPKSWWESIFSAQGFLETSALLAQISTTKVPQHYTVK